MGRRYKDAKEKKLKKLLTGQQFQQINRTEDYINDQIDEQVDNQNVDVGGTTSVLIGYCIMRFECEPDGTPLTYPETERQYMQDILFTRIKDDGWSIMTDDFKNNWIIYTRNF